MAGKNIENSAMDLAITEPETNGTEMLHPLGNYQVSKEFPG